MFTLHQLCCWKKCHFGDKDQSRATEVTFFHQGLVNGRLDLQFTPSRRGYSVLITPGLRFYFTNEKADNPLHLRGHLVSNSSS